jgi:pimeloyl-ACP methyl ester carboxylesterase
MADFRNFEEYQIPVPGGDLAVVRWPAADADAPTAVLVHGITANALAWAATAEAVDGRVNLLAMDLRGRAYSRHIAPPPPWGLDADAEDVIAVLDHAGLDAAVLVGHSLGAFVACTAAARHPERVLSLVAVDGGARFGLPPDIDPDELLELTVGPAVKKLRMVFADGEAYLDFHRAHPSFVGNWSPQLTAYLARDTLWLPDGRVVSSCIEAAIRADGRQLIVDDFVNDAINYTTCPVTLLCAERGILNQPQGFYSDEVLDAAGIDRDRVAAELIPNTNHYTLVGPGNGADSIAAAILSHVGATTGDASKPTGGGMPLRGAA